MMDKYSSFTIGKLLEQFPWAEDFFSTYSIDSSKWKNCTFDTLCKSLTEDFYSERGLSPSDFSNIFFLYLEEMNTFAESKTNKIKSIKILPGRNKTGKSESHEVLLEMGKITAIVGPTGSGKSRLLEDIECLAQRDTPTRRKILVDGEEPSYDARFSCEGRLIAQLSQNMNYVMDLSVQEFLTMHAESKLAENIENLVETVFEKANNLAGEPFFKDTPVTQLSGGQSRALMIADTALLSQAPIILIDEIENAGVDKGKALELLIDNNKIVLIATHDPYLALCADQRMIIKNGGIEKIIKTTGNEQKKLIKLKELEETLNSLRNSLRRGDIL